MTMKSIRKYRRIPFVKRGMRVFSTYKNKFGVICGANCSGNLNIRFEGETFSENCHPHWMLQYFDKNNNVIAEYGG